MSDQDVRPSKNTYAIPLAIVLAGALIAGAVVYSAGQKENSTAGNGAETQAKAKLTPITDKDHIIGSRDADVILVEFSDFQCGYCARFHETVKELVKEYDGKLAWVYRHLPVGSGGPEATPAAIASECVAELAGNEAFWTFAEKTLANQRALSTAWYLETAKGLGINEAAFTECFESGKYDTLIDEQTANATALGAQGTPHSILLTREGETFMFRGALPIENVRSVVDRALRSLE